MLRSFFTLILFLSIFNLNHASGDETKQRYVLLLPLTGEYARFGEDCRRGSDLAVGQDNKAKELLEIIYSDTQGLAKVAVSEFKKLAANSDDVFFVQRSPLGAALNPLSQQQKIPLFGGVGLNSFTLKNNYAFQMWVPAQEEGAFIAEEINQQNYKNIALMTLEDEWTLDVTTGFRKAFSNSNKIIFDEQTMPSDNDFRTQITKLKTLKPDVIFVNVGLAQLAAVFKQLKELGINIPIYSTFWAGKKDVISAADGAAEGIKYAEMRTDYPSFYDDYFKKYNDYPTAATFSTFVSTKLLLQAVKEKVESPNESIYDILLKQKSIKLKEVDLQMVERKVKFDLVTKVIKDGKIELFK